MLRGLYCPFCRRHISLLRPACETLQDGGITLLGLVIASPERSRQYFRHFPACFPIAAAPDRAIHRAYGLPEVVRTPELRQRAERRAAGILQERSLEAPPGQAASVFAASDGFEMTTEDQAEWQRPLQVVGHFLIGRDGLIRWARVETSLTCFASNRRIALPAVTLRWQRYVGCAAAYSRRRTSRCSGPRARDARASAAERHVGRQERGTYAFRDCSQRSQVIRGMSGGISP
jgi:AhpC/TSA family